MAVKTCCGKSKGGHEAATLNLISYKYTRFLYRFRYAIIAVWLAVAAAFAYFAIIYMPSTRMEFVPPPSSQAAEAHKIMSQYFPEIEDSGMNMVFIETPDESNIRDYHEQLKAFTDTLTNELKAYDFITLVIGVTQIEDLLWETEEGSLLSDLFYSADNTATFIVVQANKKAKGYSTNTLTDAMNNAIEVAMNASFDESFEPAPIGMDIILQLCTDSTMADLGLMDVTVIPIAFVFFAVFLKSVRLLIIPLVQLVVILSLSFGVSYFMTYSVTVPPFTPSIQSAFCLALTVDYCLFLMSSFRTAISAGLPVVPAVRYMIVAAGKVVAISCFSVTLSVTSLMFYNIDIIRICGYGTIITLLSLLIVCLTLLPAMILAFPKFFSHFGFNKGHPPPMFYTQEEAENEDTEEETENSRGSVMEGDADELENHPAPLAPKESPITTSRTTDEPGITNVGSNSEICRNTKMDSDGEDERNVEDGREGGKKKRKSCREGYKEFCAKLALYPKKVVLGLTKNKGISWAALIGTLCVAAPFTYFAVTMKTTMDLNMVLPRGDNIVDKTNDFANKFSPGLAFQAYLVFTPIEGKGTLNGTIFDEERFNVIADVAEALAGELEAAGLLSKNNYIGPSNIPGVIPGGTQDEPRDSLKVPWDFVDKCINGDESLRPSEKVLCEMYKAFIKGFVSEEHEGAAIMYIPEVGIDCVGSDLLTEVMRRYASLETLAAVGLRGDVWGLMIDMTDCSDYVMKMFPIVTAVVVVVVFVVMAIAYSSIFTIIRLIFSIAVTISIALGVLVLVYHYGVGFDIFWAVMPFGFCIMVGLSCDYDSFIYSFFKDFRFMRFTEQGAIRKAVHEVTPIVNAAGLIMGVSFVGLLISHLTLLQQFGVLLLLDVLVETFWVRPFFVSSFINVFRRVVHWPFAWRLPPEEYNEDHRAGTDYGIKFSSVGWVWNKKGKDGGEEQDLAMENVDSKNTSSSIDSNDRVA